MKLNPDESEFEKEITSKLRKRLGDEIGWHMLTTLLDVSDQICKYIIETRQASSAPYQVKSAMLHVCAILTMCIKALRTDDEIKIGGFFPVDQNSWKSEEDFEKRFILLVKLYHEQLKKEGKL